jgi:hypothetical protein
MKMLKSRHIDEWWLRSLVNKKFKPRKKVQSRSYSKGGRYQFDEDERVYESVHALFASRF